MDRIARGLAVVVLAAGLVACGSGGQGPTQPDVDPEGGESDGEGLPESDVTPAPPDDSPPPGEAEDFGSDP